MNGNSAQVIGKVNPDHSIKVLTSKDVGEAGKYPLILPLPPAPNSPFPTFLTILLRKRQADIPDFQLYQSVVDVTHQHKDLFICDAN